MKVRMKMVLLAIKEPLEWHTEGFSLQQNQEMVASFVDEFIDLVGFQIGSFHKLQMTGHNFFVFNDKTKEFVEVIYET